MRRERPASPPDKKKGPQGLTKRAEYQNTPRKSKPQTKSIQICGREMRRLGPIDGEPLLQLISSYNKAAENWNRSNRRGKLPSARYVYADGLMFYMHRDEFRFLGLIVELSELRRWALINTRDWRWWTPSQDLREHRTLRAECVADAWRYTTVREG